MIKIDFHIHTCSGPNKKDENLIFSMDKIVNYVNDKKINAIAITNHNTFDKANFDAIVNELSEISVFPGVEVDLERGHLLVIAKPEDKNTFIKEVDDLETRITNKKWITFEEFAQCFPNYENYLLIPHYDKKPSLPLETINKFGENIYCGEVTSLKKFTYMKKDEEERLTPVQFSDMRMNEESKLSGRQTYLDTDNRSFENIRYVLKSKDKVYLGKDKGDSTFEITSDGFVASKGLNVVIGKRSTGKTYLLDEIMDAFNGGKDDVFYLKQFSLVSKSKDEEEKLFNEELGADKRNYKAEYLKLFSDVINDVLNVDINENNTNFDNYFNILIDRAETEQSNDIFSKVPLFDEDVFDELSSDKEDKIIKAILVLLESNDHKSIINKYVSDESLLNLLNEMIILSKRKRYKSIICTQSNKILRDLKNALASKSATKQIPEMHFKDLIIDYYKIIKFEKICAKFRKYKITDSKSLGDFKIVAAINPATSIEELKSGLKTPSKKAFSKLYKKISTNEFYKALLVNKESELLSNDELPYAFCKIDYLVKNKYDLNVSGGEQSEFRLLNEIQKAGNKDIVLIDEIESSFDNIFLKEKINTMIRNISKEKPVFLVTHNNVVGASIRPDYVIYTESELDDKKNLIFHKYGGEFGSKTLKDVSGREIKNFTALTDSLEGGIKAYKEREKDYENIKD